MNEPAIRYNRRDMPQCCFDSLIAEAYRRRDANEEIMPEGDTIICGKCGGELICDRGTEDKLRWRWKA